MAIVKANYVKRGRGVRERAKATLNYNSERPGKEGAKITREIFGADGTLSREQVHRMIDEAGKGTLFYRLVISPDPRREDGRRDLDLPGLTIRTILELEERLKTKISFAAVEHNDHAPHRHVHVLAIIPRKLTREDIDFLRGQATEITRQQRRVRDLTAERRLGLSSARYPSQAPRVRLRQLRVYAPYPGRPMVTCPSCSEGTAQTMEKITSRLHKCSSCGIVVRATALGMEIENSTFGREFTL